MSLVEEKWFLQLKHWFMGYGNRLPTTELGMSNQVVTDYHPMVIGYRPALKNSKCPFQITLNVSQLVSNPL